MAATPCALWSFSPYDQNSENRQPSTFPDGLSIFLKTLYSCFTD